MQMHKAYLIEDLKQTGLTIMSKLAKSFVRRAGYSNSTSSADDVTTVDIVDCPLFMTSQLQLQKGSNNYVIAMVAISLIVVIVAVNIGYCAIVKLRLVPKIRARFVENTPYEDIVITE